MSFVAVAIGAVALGGAAYMGMEAQNAQSDALGDILNSSNDQYGRLANYQQTQGASILDQFLTARKSQINDYTQQYQQSIGNYDQQYASIQQNYAQAMQGVYNTAASGRDNTLAAIDQATARSTHATQQSQALTGLANTSWGDSYLSSIQNQGALNKGIVQEQYASTLAGIQNQTAQGNLNLALGRNQGVTGMQQQLAGNQQQLGGQLSGQELQGRMGILNNNQSIEMQRISNSLGLQGQQAQFAGSGWAAGSGFLSGIGSALIGAGAQGMMGGSMGGGDLTDAQLTSGQLAARQAERGF